MSNSVIDKIPFLNLKKQYLQIKDEVLEAVEQVFESTAFTDGPFVKKFEQSYAQFCEAKHAVGVTNGTAALHLAMIALGVGPGDEVIVPANTFIASAWGVSYLGAKLIFIDCDPDTWQIDIAQLEEKITSKTKLIVGVHLYGQPFDIDAVQKIATKHDVMLLEDAAQAHGARYKGKRVGGFGEIACFSFYPGKNLGTYGEGGGITTNSEKYDTHLRSLRNHGMLKKYYHDEIGYNMRMGGVEGAVLSVKLKYIDSWNARRQQIAKMYQEGLTNSKIKLQKQPDFSESVYHLFVITSQDREGLMKYLNENGIFPGMHYPVPCHLQKAYAHLGHKKGDFPNSEYLADHCISLPMFPELSDAEVNKVIEVLNKY